MASRFLIKHGISSLPVDSLTLAESIGIELTTYSDLSRQTGDAIEVFSAKYDPDGFICWSNHRLRFVLCYNDTAPLPLIRWTAMHEIGHVVLGHVVSRCVSWSTPALPRVRDPARRGMMEKEADGFARQVLCPPIILHHCHAVTPSDIMNLCGVSLSVARHHAELVQRLEAQNAYHADPLEDAVERQFALFIRNVKEKR